MKNKILITIGLVLGGGAIFWTVFAITPDNIEGKQVLANIKMYREELTDIVCKHATGITLEPQKYDWDTYAWASGAYWRCRNDEFIGGDDLNMVENMIEARIYNEENKELFDEVEEATSRDNPN